MILTRLHHGLCYELSTRFVSYFGDKIKAICQDLGNSSNNRDYTVNVASDFDGAPLEKFRTVSQDEVRKIILSSPSKSFSLDPISMPILKLCLDELTPVLALIVNTSLELADFSPELKRAFIVPLMKKAILDCEIWKNFRPVSKLSFLSKLTERIVCAQLVDHLKAHYLYEVDQSAHRQLHSTETALLNVQKYLLHVRHSQRSNSRSTGSQCCIWYDWPPPLTSYTGIIISHVQFWTGSNDT